MRGIRPLVAGNWKMHGLGTSLAELRSLKDRLAEAPVPEADAKGSRGGRSGGHAPRAPHVSALRNMNKAPAYKAPRMPRRQS